MHWTATIAFAGLVFAQDTDEVSSPNGSDSKPAPVTTPATTTGASAPRDPRLDPIGWQPLDHVVFILDDDALSNQDYEMLLEMERRRTALSTQRQVQELIQRLTVDEADRILSTQAGRDLGIDPEQVASLVQRNIDDIKDRVGVVELSHALRGMGMDSKRWRDQRAGDVYRDYWEELMMGKQPNMEGRYVKDRFVRPGYLRYAFDRLVRYDEVLVELGGQPEEVVIQVLYVSTTKERGGVEGARREAATIRLEVMAGEDFGEFVERYNEAADNQGIEASRPTSQFRAIPGIFNFLASAEVGDVSKPIAVERDGRIQAWRVVKLVERRERKVPDFDSPEVQERVKELTLKEMDQVHLHVALNELYETAYIWPDSERKRIRSRPLIPPRVTRTDEAQ